MPYSAAAATINSLFNFVKKEVNFITSSLIYWDIFNIKFSGVVVKWPE